MSETKDEEAAVNKFLANQKPAKCLRDENDVHLHSPCSAGQCQYPNCRYEEVKS
jgi:hypothetical protein